MTYTTNPSLDFIPEAAPEPSSPSATRVVTFGCRLNNYESEIIRKLAEENNLKNTIFVNTCTVTGEAERQGRQAIRRLRRENPSARIIVTGCAAQANTKTYEAMPEIDHVIGNHEKLQSDFYQRLSQDSLPKVVLTDIKSIRETSAHLVSEFAGKTRAFVQIQSGCNHDCTFCQIPQGRGLNRSVPIGHIVEQVRKLVAEHYQEIVFTGVDITDYGKDLPGSPTLGQLVRRTLALVPELARLRLSSLDPVEIDEDLFQQFAEQERLMPHAHLSIQAGDDMILRRMKRRHLRHHVFTTCNRLRSLRSDIVFGADLIAGFPTETEEMFGNTLQLVTECNILYLHVFPFSPRPNTPAARMPQVAKSAVKSRAAMLRSAGEGNLQQFLSAQVGKKLKVMVESPEIARTEQYSTVKIAPNEHAKIGTIYLAEINSCDPQNLHGALLI